MKSRQEAEKYLEQYIPKSISQKFPADHGLKRAALLLELLGNPQEKMRIIHVAGTSGKGTTAYITSKLLQSHGEKAGLHLSPHLEDIRERMLVENKFISDDKFLSYFTSVIEAAKACTREFDIPTYFEITTAMAFYVFAHEKVDVAVVETGMGGTYDATNTIKRRDKVCVITRIGKDHTNILGTTLKEIAAQKAGIIHKGNTVITLASGVQKVFEEKAKKEGAKLYILNKVHYKNEVLEKRGLTFDFSFQDIKDTVFLSLPGRHQAENAALALAATHTLTKLDKTKVKQTLQNIHFKGRLDIRQKEGKTIIIDGAHNEQKMRALTTTLKALYPDKKFTTILAVKRGKDLTRLLKLLQPITSTLITTTYFKDTQDLLHIAHETDTVAKKAEKVGFKKVVTTSNPKEAFEHAMKLPDPILATGSLYYLQDVYAVLEDREEP